MVDFAKKITLFVPASYRELARQLGQSNKNDNSPNRVVLEGSIYFISDEQSRKFLSATCNKNTRGIQRSNLGCSLIAAKYVGTDIKKLFEFVVADGYLNMIFEAYFSCCVSLPKNNTAEDYTKNYEKLGLTATDLFYFVEIIKVFKAVHENNMYYDNSISRQHFVKYIVDLLYQSKRLGVLETVYKSIANISGREVQYVSTEDQSISRKQSILDVAKHVEALLAVSFAEQELPDHMDFERINDCVPFARFLSDAKERLTSGDLTVIRDIGKPYAGVSHGAHLIEILTGFEDVFGLMMNPLSKVEVDVHEVVHSEHCALENNVTAARSEAEAFVLGTMAQVAQNEQSIYMYGETNPFATDYRSYGLTLDEADVIARVWKGYDVLKFLASKEMSLDGNAETRAGVKRLFKGDYEDCDDAKEIMERVENAQAMRIGAKKFVEKLYMIAKDQEAARQKRFSHVILEYTNPFLNDEGEVDTNVGELKFPVSGEPMNGDYFERYLYKIDKIIENKEFLDDNEFEILTDAIFRIATCYAYVSQDNAEYFLEVLAEKIVPRWVGVNKLQLLRCEE